MVRSNQKQREKLRSDELFLQDNAPIHNAQLAAVDETNSSLGLQLHLPYSADLAPSNFFLFPKLKSHLCCHHFGNKMRSYMLWRSFLQNKDVTFFFGDEVTMLEHRLTKWIDIKGFYIEK